MSSQELATSLSQVRGLSTAQNGHQYASMLSAVEDIMKARKMPFEPTAYLVVLLQLLDAPESRNSAVYILSLVIPHVGRQLLVSKTALLAERIAPIMSDPEAETSVVRSAIACIQGLIQPQHVTSWATPASEMGPARLLLAIISLARDSRPKIRKRAIEAIDVLMNALTEEGTKPHPIVTVAAPATLQALQDSKEVPSETIHALQTVKHVVAYGWPSKLAAQLCKTLLALTKKSEKFVLEVIFEVFEQFTKTLSSEGKQGKKLLAEINEIIFKMAPSKLDKQLTPSWLALVAHSSASYAEIDPDAAFAQTCQRLPVLIDYLVESSEEVAESCKSCIVLLLEQTVPQAPATESQAPLFAQLGEIMFSLLKVEHHVHWHLVREIICAYLDSAQQNAVFDNVLRVLGVLRGDSGHGLDRAATDSMIGSAVRALGPEKVLSLIPLDLSAQSAAGNVWLLPLLRDNIRTARIGHFKDVFLPVSDSLKSAVDASKNPRNAKIIDTVRDQVWSLLPRYMDLPLDVEASFDKQFVELLVDTLYSQPKYRGYVVDGFRNIVESIHVWASDEVGDELLQARFNQEQALSALKYLQDNFVSDILKILLNLFSEDTGEEKQGLLSTIHLYFSITSPEQVEEIFNQISTAMVASIQQDNVKLTASLLDIVVGLAPHLNKSSITAFMSMFKVIAPRRGIAAVQKKVYMALHQFAQSDIGQKYMKQHYVEIIQYLLEISESAEPSSRRGRLLVFSEVCKIIPESDLVYLTQLLPEAILAVKDMNEKTRSTAFEFLEAVGRKMASGGSIDRSLLDPEADGEVVESSLSEFFTAVMAGLLSDEPHMISASITALTYLLYIFRDQLSSELIAELTESVYLFLTTKNREIIKSVLGFVKVSVTTLPLDDIESKLKPLLKDLLEWESEHKQLFRLKVRHIIERLLRRFDYNVVAANFPEGDMKLLQNIVKSKQRQKRKNANGGTGPKSHSSKFDDGFDEALYGSSDEDDEDEVMDTVGKAGPKPQKVTSKAGARLGTPRQEKRAALAREQRGFADTGELDLLDDNAMTFVSAGNVPQPKKELAHKLAEKDGKVIINDNDDDAEPVSSIDAYVEAVRNGPVRTQRGKLKFKNQKRQSMDSDNEDANEKQPPNKQAKRKMARTQRRRL